MGVPQTRKAPIYIHALSAIRTHDHRVRMTKTALLQILEISTVDLKICD
jgi:hypothetical protein